MGRIEKINNVGKTEKPDNAGKTEKTYNADEESLNGLDYNSLDSASTFLKPSTLPPPYFKTRFIKPGSFKAAILARRDEPAVLLFRLTTRLLQFAFAVASGVSYAIELNHDYSASNTNFIFAEIVFGLTLLTIIVDSVTAQYYRFIWAFEWTMTVLWIACFDVFYGVYLDGGVPADYAVVDFGRMKLAGWCNLVNALLWLCTALFSSVMCCSGTKTAVVIKIEERRQRKEEEKAGNKIERMENGTVTHRHI